MLGVACKCMSTQSCCLFTTLGHVLLIKVLRLTVAMYFNVYSKTRVTGEKLGSYLVQYYRTSILKSSSSVMCNGYVAASIVSLLSSSDAGKPFSHTILKF